MIDVSVKRYGLISAILHIVFQCIAIYDWILVKWHFICEIAGQAKLNPEHYLIKYMDGQ